MKTIVYICFYDFKIFVEYGVILFSYVCKYSYKEILKGLFEITFKIRKVSWVSHSTI